MNRRLPNAVYRLQFHAGFGFDDARRLVPYLHALGITDLYASPLLKPRSGSTHGYDVTDVTALNPALGTEEDFRALAAELGRNDMGLLLDIVPNHMAASHENPWWRSVLEYGPASPHAAAFDIDWEMQPGGKLLVPILGAPYGDVLSNGELRLGLDDTGFSIHYFEHLFPVCPWTYRSILARAARRLRESTAILPAALEALDRLLQAADMHAVHLTPPEEAYRYGEGLKANLSQLRREHPAVDACLQESVANWGSNLDALLARQPYRLAHWRLAAEAVNYRRFFDINDLAGIRVELPEIFEKSHAKIISLAQEGLITGLRIDHIDGLYDPQRYLELLQHRLGNFYIAVEKILGPDETLSPSWPVAGTTGYDFLSLANGMFVNQRGLHYLDRQYASFTHNPQSFTERVTQAKEFVVQELFPGELERLTGRLARLAAADLQARDLPRKELEGALAQVTATFPVYRTYIRDPSVTAPDRERILQALTAARERTPASRVSPGAFAFLERTLLLTNPSDEAVAFIRRWQQFSGPVMAKGLEDTAFFRHTRLISLNAVGGLAAEIEQPADVRAFHAYQSHQQQTRPHTMLTLSTHDTKRSGDVSARINVVSELPFAWARAFRKWRRLTKPLRKTVGSRSVPSPDEELMLYQTLIGSWPWDDTERDPYPARMVAFVRKAAREAKVNTDWIRPDEAYEAALTGFTADILDPAKAADFLTDLTAFQTKIAFLGGLNGLSQSLLLATSPGVPDIYQGTELWDFSLTDPDNRRPVDFQRRIDALAALPAGGMWLEQAALEELLCRWPDGRIKLYVLSRALHWRRRDPALFRDGAYLPIYAAGRRQRNVCAFLRRQGARWALTAVPRQVNEITRKGRFPRTKKSWGGTFLTLPQDAPELWTNVLTGETWRLRPNASGERLFPLHHVFRRFPAALLMGDIVAPPSPFC